MEGRLFDDKALAGKPFALSELNKPFCLWTAFRENTAFDHDPLDQSGFHTVQLTFHFPLLTFSTYLNGFMSGTLQ